MTKSMLAAAATAALTLALSGCGSPEEELEPLVSDYCGMLEERAAAMGVGDRDTVSSVVRELGELTERVRVAGISDDEFQAAAQTECGDLVAQLP